jgi:hypothetical protein
MTAQTSSFGTEAPAASLAMINPTLIKAERVGPRRRSGPMNTIAIALAVGMIFGVGVYALMDPHSGATVSTSTLATGSAMPSVAR